MVDVSRVVAIREKLSVRVGWCALFTKAYALVALKMPEIRRVYLEHPLTRLYQHPF